MTRHARLYDTVRRGPSRSLHGFTLVELLVVIAILGLLLSILLPALNVAINRSQRAASNMQLESVSRAIQTYQMDHGALPGPVAEGALDSIPEDMSGTENLTLGLLGQLTTDSDGIDASAVLQNGDAMKVDTDKIGDGPMDMNSGRKWDAYFDPKAEQIHKVETSPTFDKEKLPELVDQSSGVPLLYWRVKSDGAPVGATTGNGQLAFQNNFAYANAESLTTEQGDTYNQRTSSLISRKFVGGNSNAFDNLAWLLADEDLSDLSNSNGANGIEDTINGGYVLISPGPDGIYFNTDDVDGTTALDSVDQRNEFDDIVIVGSK